MKSIASRAVFACLLLVVLGVTGVRATEDPRDLIQAYRIWKLTDALGLSEEQMPLFFSKIREIDKRESQLRQDELEALGEIRHLLEKQGASEEDLDRALAEYDGIRTRRWEETTRLRREAAGMLTAKQRCQFVVFEERFKAHIKEMIGRVRDINRQGSLRDGGGAGRDGGFGRGDTGPGRPGDTGAGRSRPQGTSRGRR